MIVHSYTHPYSRVSGSVLYTAMVSECVHIYVCMHTNTFTVTFNDIYVMMVILMVVIKSIFSNSCNCLQVTMLFYFIFLLILCVD